jgi:uroporphyrinogen decarboxylase
MTHRERILAVLHGRLPDCVPVCPDISNMVPCRLTGKPFWNVYVSQDPPLWKAYIDAVKRYDIDGGFEFYQLSIDDLRFPAAPASCEERVVLRRPDGSFATQVFDLYHSLWHGLVTFYTADNPPATNVLPEKLGLPAEPREWEPLTGVKVWPKGLDLWRLVRQEMGEHGVLGLCSGTTTAMLGGPEDIYAYTDDPKPFFERRDRAMEACEERIRFVSRMDDPPDFLLCGGSGSLVWQSPEIFRELSLPILKHITKLAHEAGIPTHVHSCGPEKELVAMAAEETDLTIIDPLEIAPMGDCDLAELKKRFGHKIVLKGNLHTTEVMLRGSVADVVAASRKAIDEGGAGGGFILSTGDQCGRDTPEENLRAMVETARTYGKYE